MPFLTESPWYREIEQRGRIAGIQSAIKTVLEAKFGAEGLQLMSQFDDISDLDRLWKILRTIAMTSTIEKLQQNL